jgi:O-acetyl-ADP-ribose deacetylase (regulator of RNase III)
MSDRLQIVEGDIVRLAVDAVVNAANKSLLGGGGVDGALHEAAGPELRAECVLLGGCATGDAKLTHGYKLKAKHVIHTVGPMWKGGREDEPALLASCYRRSLEIAWAHRLRTVAFPSISTGIYGYPIEDASRIALQTCAEFLGRHEYPRDVTFVCFGPADFRVYREALAKFQTSRPGTPGAL